MVSQLKDVNEVSEGRRAYDALKDHVIANKNMFPVEMPLNGSAWGFVRDGFINILPTIFKKLATEQNFSTKAFCSWAMSHKLLKCNSKLQNVVKINGSPVRFYTIKLDYDEYQQEVEGFVDANENELPFD